MYIFDLYMSVIFGDLLENFSDWRCGELHEFILLVSLPPKLVPVIGQIGALWLIQKKRI